MTDETITLQIGSSLAAQLLAASREVECTPEEYLLALIEHNLGELDPTDAPIDPAGLAEVVVEARNLMLAEQMSQGAYLAARLDCLEIAVRSLLNLELQTDKRGHETTFQAIYQAISDELAQRAYAL